MTATRRRARARAEAEAAIAPESMYQSRAKVYPREVRGRFQTVRRTLVFVLLGLFYGLPWVTWNGRQAVLFDLPARQFHMFGITLWPQDFFFLTLLLILCALGLFWVTAMAGRVWCGFACPQTVWTEVFLWMERWCEGDRPRRMKLDKAPWTREKVLRKSAKHSLWLVFAAWTGFTFVGFFTPITELGVRLASVDIGPWEGFWMAFYGLATWGNAGFLRENVCLYMCPYARFQGAMFDRNTLVISYDPGRGEPRGPRRRGVAPQDVGLGDCIDCTLCVQACPTGIDIRDGLQYECIACAACIDACDDVMDRMNYPRGLIRYTTENSLEGQPARLLRPRVVIYAVMLLALATALVAGIATRTPLQLDVIPDRNALYRWADPETVENVYTLKLMNMGQQPETLTISVDGAPGLGVETDPERITVAPGETRNVPTRVRMAAGTLAGGRHDITLTASSPERPDLEASRRTRFHAPMEGTP